MPATAERLGLRDLAAGARHNLGIALCRTGALEEARAVESAAVRASVAQRNRRLESGCRTYLATILLTPLKTIPAAPSAKPAPPSTSSRWPRRCGPTPWAPGRVLLAQGRPAEALAATSEAVTLMQSEEGIEEGEALVHLAHLRGVGRGRTPRGGARDDGPCRHCLLARAQRISDRASRESFLSRVPDNARILDQARLWLGG